MRIGNSILALGFILAACSPMRSATNGTTAASAVASRRHSGESSVPAGPAQIEMATGFAKRLAAAFSARYLSRAAALFAEIAVSTVVGDSIEDCGRDAIEADFQAVLNRCDAAKLTIGRIWVGAAASVIEFLFTGTCAADNGMMRSIGFVGAAVVHFDDAGLVNTQRVYLDDVTIVGQMQPTWLPEGIMVRPVVGSLPAGSAVLASGSTAMEAAELEVADSVWAAMDAHQPASVMAPAADNYVYEDYAAPGPLNRTSTQQMVARFLAAVPDFTIAAKPVHFAAGAEVVTEMIEHMTYLGRAVTLHGLDIKRLADGKVVREWQYANGREALTRMLGLTLPTFSPASRKPARQSE